MQVLVLTFVLCWLAARRWCIASVRMGLLGVTLSTLWQLSERERDRLPRLSIRPPVSLSLQVPPDLPTQLPAPLSLEPRECCCLGVRVSGVPAVGVPATLVSLLMLFLLLLLLLLLVTADCSGTWMTRWPCERTETLTLMSTLSPSVAAPPSLWL